MPDFMNETGWVNKAATGAVIALIGWNVLTTQKMSVEIAVLSNQVSTLDTGVTILKSTVERGTADRYTRTQAQSDLAIVKHQVKLLEENVDALESELVKLRSELKE